MLNKYTNLVQAINAFRSQGFIYNFYYKEKVGLICQENNRTYAQHQLKINEYHRFGSSRYPQNMSILFVIECSDGLKGTITSSYNDYMDGKLATFLSNVKVSVQSC
ncbi:MAG: hypothetical protein AAF990_26605 [Bacteroidota bacterium]